MIDRSIGTSAWRPSPSYARFQREARRRAARARHIERALRVRAFLIRHALLLALCGAMVAYGVAVPVVALSAIHRDVAPQLALAEVARHDAAAYRALALGLAQERRDARLRVRLDARDREEMLVLLEQMAEALRDERGEVQP